MEKGKSPGSGRPPTGSHILGGGEAFWPQLACFCFGYY